MSHERPESDDPHASGQVLPFRSRPRSGGRNPAGADPEPNELEDRLVNDLEAFAHHEEDEDDGTSPRRMLMNVIAAFVVILLVGAGVWIADTIARMQRDQDCVMQGRRNCAPLDLSAGAR